MAAPKKIDYARIEPGWRAGILSPQQLADQYTEDTGVACSHTAIIKHFRKAGVERDLGARIKAKTEAMVSRSMVTGKVAAETNVADSKIIDASAQAAAQVAIRHRSDYLAIRNAAMDVLARALQNSDHGDTLEALAAEVATSKGDGMVDDRLLDRMREAIQRACSVGSLASSIKSLGEIVLRSIEAERVAWKLDDPAAALGGQRDMTELEVASKMAYFVDLGRRRANAPVPVVKIADAPTH